MISNRRDEILDSRLSDGPPLFPEKGIPLLELKLPVETSFDPTRPG